MSLLVQGVTKLITFFKDTNDNYLHVESKLENTITFDLFVCSSVHKYERCGLAREDALMYPFWAPCPNFFLALQMKIIHLIDRFHLPECHNSNQRNHHYLRNPFAGPSLVFLQKTSLSD